MTKPDSTEEHPQTFWNTTARDFPSLFGAPSTRYYFDCERWLFETYFPEIAGKRVFKTDLWDEAKNTRILKWPADRRAHVYGIDISSEILRRARQPFEDASQATHFAVSDVRRIAFAESSFDYLYSMGTIEHSTEYEDAARECFRVLRPGGIGIIGVPNKLDPFLRPLFVSVLYRLGLYDYGLELSFSMRSLEELLRGVGFEIVDRTGILFMPGQLRMAELFLYVRWPRSAALTAPLVAPFAWAYRRFPRLRRHGYLIACVVRKPW